MKKISLIALVLSFVFLASCTIADVTDIATINGTTILKGHYNYYIQQGKNAAMNAASVQGEALEGSEDWKNVKIGDVNAIEYAKQQADSALKQSVVMAAKAKDFKLDFTAEDSENLKKNKTQLIDNLGGRYQFEQYLNEINVTENIFDEILRNDLLAGKVYQHITSEENALIKVDADEIAKKYNEEYMAAKHILIMSTPSEENPEATPEEAEKKAKEILQQVKNGADFDALMKENSEDPGLENQPDGYVFTKGEMIPEFEKAVLALKDNEVTAELVKTDYGYHIIKRIPLPTEGDVYNSTISSVTAALNSDKLETLVEKWGEELGFKFNEKVRNNIKIVE